MSKFAIMAEYETPAEIMARQKKCMLDTKVDAFAFSNSWDGRCHGLDNAKVGYFTFFGGLTVLQLV